MASGERAGLCCGGRDVVLAAAVVVLAAVEEDGSGWICGLYFFALHVREM